MSLPEGYLPREGDVLVIHVKAEFDVNADDTDLDGKLCVHVQPVGYASFNHFRVPLKDVVKIYCRRFEPGDKVWNRDEEEGGEVIAVCDDMVWIKGTHGEMWTFGANDLEPYQETTEAFSIPPSGGVVIAATPPAATIEETP